MTNGRQPTVLVFHTSVRSSWNETLIGFYCHARQRGWNVQVIEHAPNRKSIQDLLGFWHPNGIMVEGGMDEKGVFLSDVFGNVPTVYLACDQNRLSKDALRVNHDSESLARAAAREFLSLGLRSFAFFGFDGLFWSKERGHCFREALKLNGYDASVFTRKFFESGDDRPDKCFRQEFMRWLQSLPKPCGLLAANDLLASEALSVCRTRGMNVPEDISVLGIDNDEIACENAVPTLSSIRPNFEEAGILCARLLDERMSCRRKYNGTIRYTFAAVGIVRRQSTRRLPQANADVSKAVEIIRLRACDGLKPRDVFAEIGKSRRLVEMRFRELTGHSVLDEIYAVRLARVKELLARANVPLESIASACGWKSPARLRVFFRSAEGMSMREWRNEHFASLF